MGYSLLKEKMTNFEIWAMFISLGAVVLIGVSQGNQNNEEDDEKTYIFFGSDAKTAAIVGFAVQIVKSIANGSLSVLNRKMQSIEVQVMMFYTSLISFIPMVIGLSIEKICCRSWYV